MRAQANEPPRDEQKAEMLFETGKAALDAGDLPTACARFAESQRLDPAPGTLLNLGECEARSGKLARSLVHFRQARGQLAATDYRVPFADAKIAELVRRAPRVAVRGVGAATVVTCDGVDVGLRASLGAPLTLDPGSHVFVARVEGRLTARVEILLREEEDRTVDLSAGSTPASKADAHDEAHRGASWKDLAGRLQRGSGLVAGGLGLGSIAIGSVFGLVAKASYDSAAAHCPLGPSSCSLAGVQGGQTARHQASIATAGFVVGGILLAGGAALYLTAPRGGSLSVAPALALGGVGLRISGSW